MPRSRSPEVRAVIGLDLSSRKIAAVTVTPSGGLHLLSAHLVPAKHRGGTPEACAAAYDRMHSFLGDVALMYPRARVHAWIEAPVVARGGIKTTLSQSFVSGAVQAALARVDAQVSIVFPSQWKKAVVGHGSATKEDVSRHLRGLWPVASESVGRDQDLIDATCIYLYGEQALDVDIV